MKYDFGVIRGKARYPVNIRQQTSGRSPQDGDTIKRVQRVLFFRPHKREVTAIVREAQATILRIDGWDYLLGTVSDQISEPQTIAISYVGDVLTVGRDCHAFCIAGSCDRDTLYFLERRSGPVVEWIQQK